MLSKQQRHSRKEIFDLLTIARRIAGDADLGAIENDLHRAIARIELDAKHERAAAKSANL